MKTVYILKNLMLLEFYTRLDLYDFTTLKYIDSEEIYQVWE